MSRNRTTMVLGVLLVLQAMSCLGVVWYVRRGLAASEIRQAQAAVEICTALCQTIVPVK